MDCCEDGIVDLGCVNHCGTIETGVNAPATGSYTISLVGSGGFKSVSGTIGNEITFENPFNEDAVAVFQIIRDGTALTSAGKSCFQVKVNPGIDLT